MAVDTGYYPAEMLPSDERPAFPRSSGTPLFTPNSPSDQTLSPLVFVNAGEAIIVDVYNMPQDRTIRTMRVLLGCYEPTTQISSCPPCKPQGLGRDPVILASKPMDLGTPALWIFDEETTQMVITIPGVYQFELSDEDMLDDGFYMEYRVWQLSQTPAVPAAYQGGIG